MRLVEAHLGGTTVSPADYRRQLLDVLGSLETLTAEQAADSLRLLNDTRREIQGILADLPTGSRSRAMWQRALDGADESIARFAARYASSLEAASAAGYNLGIDLALQPLTHALPGLEAVAAGVAPYTAATAAAAQPLLIQGLTDDLRHRIHSEINAAVLGSKTPQQAADAIGRNLRDPNHFRTIAHRARAITVTELGRTAALGTHQAQLELDRAVMADPDLPFTVRKRWLNAHLPGARASHLAAEARYAPGGSVGPIPIEEPFQVAGIACLFPRDPALPASETVHCHCVSVVVVPELMDGGQIDTTGITRAAGG